MPRESKKSKIARALEVEKRMDVRYGARTCPLDFWGDPFKLLIAVMLSAQTTDKSVNKVTPKLWRAYPTPVELAMANLGDVEHIISRIGLYHVKAERCVAIADAIVNKHSGIVPCDFEELQKLPGVGRKTANIVMNEGFGKPCGIAVDTHVNRIAHMLSLVPRDLKDPNKVEAELLKIYPKEFWGKINHQWVLFGREICIARHPKCNICPLSDICPSELSLD